MLKFPNLEGTVVFLGLGSCQLGYDSCYDFFGLIMKYGCILEEAMEGKIDFEHDFINRW